MRKLYLGTLLLCITAIAACTTTQQRKTYNTLYTVGQSVDTAYKGYNDLLVTGQIRPVNYKKVSTAYSDFQVYYKTAVQVFNYNTNAVAPQELIVKAAETVTIINEGKQ